MNAKALLAVAAFALAPTAANAAVVMSCEPQVGYTICEAILWDVTNPPNPPPYTYIWNTTLPAYKPNPCNNEGCIIACTVGSGSGTVSVEVRDANWGFVGSTQRPAGCPL